MNCSLQKHQYSNCTVHVTKLFIITISIFKLSSQCHWPVHYKKHQQSNCPVHVTKMFIITISKFKLSSPRHWTVHYKKHQYSNFPVHVNKIFIITISIFKLFRPRHWIVHYKNINIQNFQCMSINCLLQQYQYSNSPVQVTKLFIITIWIFKISSSCHWIEHYKKKSILKTLQSMSLNCSLQKTINIQAVQCLSLNSSL